MEKLFSSKSEHEYQQTTDKRTSLKLTESDRNADSGVIFFIFHSLLMSQNTPYLSTKSCTYSEKKQQLFTLLETYTGRHPAFQSSAYRRKTSITINFVNLVFHHGYLNTTTKNPLQSQIPNLFYEPVVWYSFKCSFHLLSYQIWTVSFCIWSDDCSVNFMLLHKSLLYRQTYVQKTE